MDTIDSLLLIPFVILAFNFVIFIFSLYMMKKRKKEFEKQQKQIDQKFRKLFDDDSLL
ncbi:hypothetical protein [Enterococcus faecalis]|uniref:hypothetical protein n=1 Tax=Enterococcus faecalis TaxID=1351 RepID=UPI0001CE4F50|nr:hypothetical protein [Enterococcus faecalis]CBL31099.1 hypothetical protein ENT_02160 [Enterococcus faecalis]